MASKKLVNTRKLLVIGTHNGSFHADEALACFMLRNTDKFRDAEVVRTRDPKQLASCDVVVDVGGVYDHDRLLYDHHQREFQDTMTIGSHQYETRLSSAGLIYRHYGLEVIENILAQKSGDTDSFGKAKDDGSLQLLYRKMYEDFVEAFDGIDNGVERYPVDIKPKYRDSTGLAARVGRLLPWWNETFASDYYDKQFEKAVDMVGAEFIDRICFLKFAWLPAREIVLRAVKGRFEVDTSGRIIKLQHSLPWKEHLFDVEEELGISSDDSSILYVLYPENHKDADSRWRIQCVPVSLGSFQNRKSLPENWCGIRDDQLSSLTGINGCVFVHASGFIGGNINFNGVLKMASVAVSTPV